MIELTVEALKQAKFRGPVVFGDGRNGMAFQMFTCTEEPRFGYEWRREDRRDRGRIRYTVDGDPVAAVGDEGLPEVIEKLKLPPDPKSYNEVMRRHREERDLKRIADKEEKEPQK